MDSAKKIVLPVAWITALCLLGDSMLYIVLPLYWEAFGLEGLWQAGILLAANRLVRLPLNPLIGYCYSRISKVSGILLACFLAVACTFAYGYLKGFGLLLAVRCIWGIAWGFLRLGGYLAILDAVPEERRGRWIGLYNGIWGIGSLAGMLAGSMLAERYGLSAASLLFGILNLTALPLCFYLMYLGPTGELAYRRGSQGSVPGAAVRSDGSTSLLETAAVLLGGMMVGIVFFGLYASTLGQLVRFQFGNALYWAGYAVGAATLAAFLQALRWAWGPLLGPLAGAWSDGTRNKKALNACGFASASMLMLGVVLPLPFAIWVAGILLLQLVNTLLANWTDAAAAGLAGRNSRIGMMTAYTLAVDLGAAIGPAAGLPLIEAWGLQVVYAAASLLLMVCAAVWMLAGRAEKRYTG